MKKNFKSISLILIIGIVMISCNQNNNSQNENVSKFTNLSGPYLGQNPLGDTAQLFAPGIISAGMDDGMVSFNKDGTELFFSTGVNRTFLYFYTSLKNGRWTEPVEFPMKRASFFRPVLNSQGNRIYCISSGYGKSIGDKSGLTRIYYFERTLDGWSEPNVIDFGEEFSYDAGHLSVATNGNIYFQTGYRIYGHEDIYFSKFENGKYLTPVKLGESINGPGHDLHPYIAPDESYIIFDANREGGYGKNDLYISFRDEKGEWSKAINMGPKVNSERDERRSSVTPDGKYLFFESSVLEELGFLHKPATLYEFIDHATSYRNGSTNIYWVDAKIIEDLKPEYLEIKSKLKW